MHRRKYLEQLVFEINDRGIGPVFTSSATPYDSGVQEYLSDDELRILKDFTTAYYELNKLAEKLAEEVGEELYDD